ncbi:hypothetical protein [Alkalilimnicola sp. S0819]|uniref:hypothetical protein n=1 Tax=Alkalilimnicola sp. S0819 TaxID=2613922 RepID=UPI001261A72B|nr:hypothetical protein [Alkalilimnicola sp. S0819]KAB7627474.1 hypothetical protein F3N43_03150 [Alkalilimnicola sp. S0819]MPQ15626.1 hypothetical protein [Alkalilimnicola sp. S0819]
MNAGFNLLSVLCWLGGAWALYRGLRPEVGVSRQALLALTLVMLGLMLQAESLWQLLKLGLIWWLGLLLCVALAESVGKPAARPDEQGKQG